LSFIEKLDLAFEVEDLNRCDIITRISFHLLEDRKFLAAIIGADPLRAQENDQDTRRSQLLLDLAVPLVAGT